MELSGYTVGNIRHRGGSSTLYEGQRESDGRPVLIRVLNESAHSSRAIELLQHAYSLAGSLEGALTPRPIALEPYQHSLALVSEDLPGQPLKRLIRQPLSLERQIQVALACADTLARFHDAGYAHRAVRPGHLLVSPGHDRVSLLDLRLAAPLASGAPLPEQPSDPAHLRYLPPELSGRVKSGWDHRADLYGLGACLFELFTGQPPFSSEDPLELIHSHIAKPPPDPGKLNPALSESLVALLHKLLAKNPDDRYQTAAGLRNDLTLCLEELRGVAGDTPRLVPDRLDTASLRLEHGIVGRSRELEVLEQSASLAAKGANRLLLLSGAAGIGKTSLVDQLALRLVSQGAIWITGKFDQLTRQAPYSALIDAFRKLVRSLLGETESSLDFWRHQIAGNLGQNGQVIIDIIPEVELIIGPQPPLERLSSTETRNRFVYTFVRFVESFCQKGHPLILFVDDLQWIDASSLYLLEALAQPAGPDYLLIIGAYRDNELDEAHPLHPALDSLREAGANIDELHLQPLRRRDIREMLTELLPAAPQDTADLADFLLKRTLGNPFFIEQTLQALRDRHLLHWNPREGRWHWDLQQLMNESMPDNVIDLVVENLRQLSGPAKSLLQRAACLGAQFSLNWLARLNGTSEAQVEDTLAEPVRLGLVHLQPPRFSHDRIQQGFYASLDEDEKARLHLRIGRLILADDTAGDEARYEAVGYLNRAIDQIDSLTERRSLAELNLAMGRQAREAAAFDTAYSLFRSGLQLLAPDSPWERHYSLQLALSEGAADAAHQAGHLEALQGLFRDIRDNARELLDRIPVYEIFIAAAIEGNQLRQATDTALEVLALMGISLPSEPRLHQVLWRFVRARLSLLGRPIRSLGGLPAMEEPLQLARMRILKVLTNAAYWSNPLLVPIAVLEQLRLVVRHGNSSHAAMTYASYGLLLCTVLRKIEAGYRFGRLALDVLEQYPSREEKPRVLLTSTAFTLHWKKHVRETFAPLQEAYRAGFEGGNVQFGNYAAWAYCINNFHAGRELNTLAREIARYSDGMLASQQITTFYGNEIYHQTVLNLLDQASDPCHLKGERYNEDEMLPIHDEARDLTEKFVLFCNKLILNFLFGRESEAFACAEKARPYLDNALGSFSVPVFHFYEALTCLALLRRPRGSWDHRLRLRRRLRQDLRKLKLWAHHAPENHRHKYLLVLAEKARLAGRINRARSLYHRATAGARAGCFIHEEALALELGARFHFGCYGDEDWKAGLLLAHARQRYQQWGALAKVRWLEARFPHSLAAFLPPERGTGLSMDSTSVDFHALKKSLSLLAGEKVHTRIIERALLMALEFAGGESVILMLPRGPDGELCVEGEFTLGDPQPRIMHGRPAKAHERVSPPVLNMVVRSRESLVIHDAQRSQDRLPELHRDPDIRRRRARSILCLPIQVDKQAPRPDAVLYLENNLAPGVFTDDRVEVLEVIGLALATTLELSQQAVTDGLTGLYNHRYFHEMLALEVQQARRQHRPLSLVMVDVDGFKDFNDRWGHQAGDQVLREVAACLRRHARESDIVARYGGEEMALILPETPIEGARQLAEQLRQKVEGHRTFFERQTLSVTISLGVATQLTEHCTPDTLIRAADQALYRAKEKGRNRVEVEPFLSDSS